VANFPEQPPCFVKLRTNKTMFSTVETLHCNVYIHAIDDANLCWYFPETEFRVTIEIDAQNTGASDTYATFGVDQNLN